MKLVGIIRYAIHTAVVSMTIGLALTLAEYLSDYVLPNSINQVVYIGAIAFSCFKFVKTQKRSMTNVERLIYATGATFFSLLTGLIALAAFLVYFELHLNLEGLNQFVDASGDSKIDITIWMAMLTFVAMLWWVLAYFFSWIFTAQMSKKFDI